MNRIKSRSVDERRRLVNARERLLIVRSHLSPNRLDCIVDLLKCYINLHDFQSAFFLQKNLLQKLKVVNLEKSNVKQMTIIVISMYFSYQMQWIHPYYFISVMKVLLKKFENNFFLLKTLSKVYFDMREVEKCEKYLLRLNKNFPNNIEVIYELIEIYMNPKYSNTLSSTNNKFITLNKKREVERKRNEKALTLVSYLLNSLKSNPTLIYQINTLLTIGELKDNLLEYKALLIARTSTDIKEMDESITLLSKLLEKALTNERKSYIHHIISTLYYRKGEFIKSIEEAENAIALERDNTLYQNRYLSLLLTMEKNKKHLALVNQLPKELTYHSSNEIWEMLCKKYNITNYAEQFQRACKSLEIAN